VAHLITRPQRRVWVARPLGGRVPTQRGPSRSTSHRDGPRGREEPPCRGKLPQVEGVANPVTSTALDRRQGTRICPRGPVPWGQLGADPRGASRRPWETRRIRTPCRGDGLSSAPPNAPRIESTLGAAAGLGDDIALRRAVRRATSARGCEVRPNPRLSDIPRASGTERGLHSDPT
jgi:hypothetical protein